MSFDVRTTPHFEREAKVLAKRYRSFKEDLRSFIDSLSEAPLQGVVLSPDIRKIRLAIASKGKGKSHGARVITHTQAIVNVNEQGVITLLTIYDKAERETISKRDIMVLMASLDDNDSDLL